MTRLTTYPNMLELANTDTLLQISEFPGTNDVEVYIQYEVDSNRTNEAGAVFTRTEFTSLVESLYMRYIQGIRFDKESIVFDA